MKIFLRTYDDVFFYDPNFLKFKIKKRKGNLIKKVKFSEYDHLFFNEDIEFKMIPSAEKALINKGILKILITEKSTLIFQDFDGKSRFLVNENNNNKVYLTFNELSIKDKICHFNLDKNDNPGLVFLEIKDLISIDMINYNNNLAKEDEFDVKKLSNYILYSDNNIIINDIIVI